MQGKLFSSGGSFFSGTGNSLTHLTYGLQPVHLWWGEGISQTCGLYKGFSVSPEVTKYVPPWQFGHMSSLQNHTGTSPSPLKSSSQFFLGHQGHGFVQTHSRCYSRHRMTILLVTALRFYGPNRNHKWYLTPHLFSDPLCYMVNSHMISYILQLSEQGWELMRRLDCMDWNRLKGKKMEHMMIFNWSDVVECSQIFLAHAGE